MELLQNFENFTCTFSHSVPSNLKDNNVSIYFPIPNCENFEDVSTIDKSKRMFSYTVLVLRLCIIIILVNIGAIFK